MTVGTRGTATFIIHADTAERLALVTRTVGEGKDKATFAPFPDFAASGWIPPPIADTRPPEYRNLMYVAPRSPRSESFGDGMLGQEWFGGGIWTFDYPGRALSWQPSATGQRFDPQHTAKVGFPAGKDGVRSGNFPSIEAAIAGETLPFLFDTGATLELSSEALESLGDGGPKSRATSFIVASVFDRWRAEHADWRVIERAEDNPGAAPIIEVPVLVIAGHRVGPVWFTRRPDPNFHEYMSGFMDRRVEGALGGSAFRFFRITADYPGARAHFERPTVAR